MLGDRARYENEGLNEYYEVLHQIIDIQISKKQSLNPYGELAYFMDIALCIDKKEEFLSVLNQLPDGDKSKEETMRLYNLFVNKKAERCRRYS